MSTEVLHIFVVKRRYKKRSRRTDTNGRGRHQKLHGYSLPRPIFTRIKLKDWANIAHHRTLTVIEENIAESKIISQSVNAFESRL